MDLRRTPWMAVIRLAVIVSAVAAGLAVALSAFGNVSQTAMVIGVIVVAFVVSWIHSGRDTVDAHDRADRSLAGKDWSSTGSGPSDHGSARHRVSVVRVHHHTG